MEEMDYYAYEESKKLTVGKVFGVILKILVYAVIISVFAIIFVRIGMQKIPNYFTEFVWTDGAKAAYADGEFEVMYQEPISSYDDRGLYYISAVHLSPESGEVQFTVRYNSRSTINTLMNAYGLSERPTGEVFIYRLADQDGKVYTSYRFAAATKPMYELRRIIFDGVDLTGVSTLYLDVYYGDDVSSEGKMNANFVIFDKEAGYLTQTFEQIADTNLRFQNAPAYINKLGEEE